MYVRVSNIESSPERIDAGIRFFQEQTLPQIRDTAGFEGASLNVDRETGRTQALTYWTTRETLESSAQDANRVRAQYVEGSQSARVISVEVYEVAVQERRAWLAETT